MRGNPPPKKLRAGRRVWATPALMAAAAALFLFESISGYLLYFYPGWTAFKQIVVLAHEWLGLPFIALFAWFTAAHLRKTVRKKRAGWALVLLTFLGVAFFLMLNNFVPMRLLKYALIVLYFLFFTDLKICVVSLAMVLGFMGLINMGLPIFERVAGRGETIDIMLFILLWVSYLWRPMRKGETYGKQAGQNFLGAASSVSVGVVIYTGILLFMGLALYSGGHTAAAFHGVAGLIAPLAAAAHAWYFFNNRHGGNFAKGVGRRWLKWAGLLIPSGAVLIAAALIAPGFKDVDLYNRVDPDYKTPYENPLFGPSEVRTSTDTLIDPRIVAGSMSCGNVPNCHKAAIGQWEESTHRRSSSTPVFRALLEAMRKEKGDEATRFCAGCHMPIDLLAGNLNPGREPVQAHMEEGIGCLVCHSIDRADAERGNGSYRFLEQQQNIVSFYDMKAGKAGPFRKWAFGQLINTIPERHVELYKDRVLMKPEYCGSCHKQFVRSELSGHDKTMELQNQYDSWAASRWNQKGFEGKPVRCQDCHMPLLESNFFGAPIRDHRFIAANVFTPTLYQTDRQLELTKLFLAGKTDEIDRRYEGELWRRGHVDRGSGGAWPFSGVWGAGPLLEMEFAEIPARVAFGSPFEAGVKTTNRRIGHRFPAGPLDLVQVWMEIRLTAADGRVLFQEGGLDRNGQILASSRRLGGVEVDAEGNPIEMHRIWNVRGKINVRHIDPGKSAEDDLEIFVPSGYQGDATLRVSWHYRSIDQAILDLLKDALPEHAQKSPAVEVGAVEKTIQIKSPAEL